MADSYIVHCMYTRTHTYTHTRTHTHTYTHIHTHIHTHTHTHRYTYTHTYTHARMHHECTHARTHAHTHTHEHTHIEMYTLEPKASHPKMILSRGCGHTFFIIDEDEWWYKNALTYPEKNDGRVVQTKGLSDGGAIKTLMYTHTRTHTHTQQNLISVLGRNIQKGIRPNSAKSSHTTCHM